MANSLTKEFSITSYDLNPQSKARLTTIANFFQEMAYHHAKQLGFGYEDMNEKSTLWVLSRMRIRMNQYPVWNDQLKVETWHRGMDRLFGLRDFKVMDASGTVLGMASSAWLILDIATRRPVRATAGVLNKSRGEEKAFESDLVKIPLPEGMEMITNRKVVYADLDIMGHVNNVKYMEWCIDASFTKNEDNREIREFEINFMNEALLGDEIEIRGKENPVVDGLGELGFLAVRKSDNKEIFRSRILFLRY